MSSYILVVANATYTKMLQNIVSRYHDQDCARYSGLTKSLIKTCITQLNCYLNYMSWEKIASEKISVIGFNHTIIVQLANTKFFTSMVTLGNKIVPILLASPSRKKVSGTFFALQVLNFCVPVEITRMISLLLLWLFLQESWTHLCSPVIIYSLC